MKKFKNIFGLALTSALSLAISVSALAGAKPASADASVIYPEAIVSQFSVGNATVTPASYMPEYIVKKGNWKGPSNGVQITFASAGKENSVVYNKVFSVSDLTTVASFNALPDEATYKKPAVAFQNLHVVVFEVDNAGNPTGKEVAFRYSSGYSNSAAMKGLDEGGEQSAYFSAFATTDGTPATTQKPYAIVNDSTGYSSFVPTGSPRYLTSGAGGSTWIHASMQGSASNKLEPMNFGYVESGTGENFVSYGTASPARYAHTVRVFNEYRDPKTKFTEDQIASKSYVDDPVTFAGFGATAKLKVKFYIDGFAGGNTKASFMLFKIGTDKLINRVEASSNYYGIKNVAYPIPAAKVFDASGALVAGAPYTVKVTKKGESAVIATGANLASFTPTSAGEYVLDYVATASDGTYGYKITVTVKDEISDVQLKNVMPASDFNKVYGSNYTVSAESLSLVYTDETTPNITVKLYKDNGSGKDFIKNLSVNQILNLKTDNLGFGKYIVEYTATDVLGRTAKQEVILNQIEENRLTVSMLNGIENSTENFYYGTGDELTISEQDVTIYDGLLGRDFIAPVVTITDPNSGVYTVVDSVNFANYLEEEADNLCGEYLVSYNYSYNFGGVLGTVNKTLTKTINVVDTISPEISSVTERRIFGAKIDAEKTVSNDVVYFTAITGSNLKFDAVIAIDRVGEEYSLTDTMTLMIVEPNGTITNLTPAMYDPLNFEYVVGNKGQYVFRFDVNDVVNGAPNRHTSLVYIVDVANNFYDMTILNNYDINNNFDSVKLSDVVVTDYDGNKVNVDVTVTAYDNKGEVLWTGKPGDVKKFVITGDYEIVTEAKLNGAVICAETANVTIYDTLKPTITVKGDLIIKGIVGKAITLPTVEAEDDNGYYNVELNVTLNGNTINVYNGKFTPIESGDYVVTYTVTDMAGNENTYTYEIIVIDDYEGGLASFFNNYGLFVAIPLILIAGALVALFIIKNKKSATEIINVDDNEI